MTFWSAFSSVLQHNLTWWVVSGCGSVGHIETFQSELASSLLFSSRRSLPDSLFPRIRNKETIPQSFCCSRFGVKAIIIKDFSSPPYFIFPKQREAAIFSLTGRRVWDKEMISRPLLRTILISPPTVLAAQSSILNSESPRQRDDSSFPLSLPWEQSSYLLALC